MHKYIIMLLLLTGTLHSSTWTRTFSEVHSKGYDVVISRDSCYVVVGYILSGSKYDLWLLKVNKDGVLIWDKKFSGSYSRYGYSVDTTYDGGYIITGATATGTSTYSALLIKADSSGNELWTESFNLTTSDKGNCVKQTIDSGYIVEGCTYDGNMLLIKTDKDGNLIWQKRHKAYGMSLGGGVCETPDSNYLAVGASYDSTDTMQCSFVLKADKNGDTLWSRNLIGYKKRTVHGQHIYKTLDNNYIINMAVTYSYGGWPYGYYYSYSAYLIKIDLNGDTLWTKKIQDASNGYGLKHCSAYPTTDSGYIVTNGEYLLKTNKMGTNQWNKMFFNTDNLSVKETSDGGYVMTGGADMYAGSISALCLIKSDPGAVEEENQISNLKSQRLRASPNPFTNTTGIRGLGLGIGKEEKVNIRIYDISGKLVESFDKAQDKGAEIVIGKDLKPGVYFAKVKGYEPVKILKISNIKN